MENTFCPTTETMKRFSNDFGLDRRLMSLDDWEYIAADKTRIPQYFAYYKSASLNTNEKQTLLCMILQAYNDHIGDHGLDPEYTGELERLLQAEYAICAEIVDYWACLEDSPKSRKTHST